jgi:hypothetical protein
MIVKRAFKAIRGAAKAFVNSDFFRRALTTKPFPDTDKRKSKVPTLGDHTDVDVEQVSGDEFVVTIAKGRGALEGKQEKLMQKQKIREEQNPILPDNQRPSIRELNKEHLEEKLNDLQKQIEETE